ncbi:hypothetical protein [Telluribacter sp. SYSU D00476]|uniref:hypothetical protein n=1 Tax=Telluribacter sp. SYSU D00476 TaxID=2811430 RepID=UPI001FF49E2D|nr:hypothetical protein [Telluribacter sp. SYSU D00476]
MKRDTLVAGMAMAGLSLGTAWAIRGQFGHEQGAAWAGAIGSLSILLITKRDDWYRRAFQATLAGALGWGVGGIMSYGAVVGYGRDVEFINVYYGLFMLFVIGGLYGFMGGGLFGLALADGTRGEKVHWPQLIVEMTVGALLFYFFLIEQFGWLMTPPRSELWAACLGMAAALTWYLVRQGYYAALRVAVFAGLGGGFGFAFGNFLQVLGHVSGIPFNFWNVMEYSLGFFGGAGMAYGTFTSRWEAAKTPTSRSSTLFPLLFLVLIIPFVVWDQSFETESLSRTFDGIGATPGVVGEVQWVAILLILVLTGVWVYRYYLTRTGTAATFTYHDILIFFLGHFALYILYSLLITGAFLSTYRIEQYLYIVNYLIIALLIGKVRAEFAERGVAVRAWSAGLVAVGVLIALLSFIAISTHGELPHAQKRFNTLQARNQDNI